MQRRLWAALAAIGFAAVAAAAGAQSARPVDEARILAADSAGEWLTYGRSYSEQRYSPLTQIDAGTVGRLGLAWWAEFDTDRGQEATPLMADGVIYTSTAWSKVYAFDAQTGRRLWSYDPRVDGARAFDACCDVVNRGVALWKGQVFVGALDGRLIALDARTGAEKWSVQTTDASKPYTITGAPRVVKDKVLIGNGGAEYGVRGYISAYDAQTGRLAWRFYTTPNPELKPDGAASDAVFAAKANATWFGDVWKASGGGGTVWDAITYDAQTGLLYFGVGNGAPWNHAVRSAGRGDNLFLSSIVAVRPETGEYVWHYQTTPGDNWDYTAVQQIMVADLDIGGRRRHVVMQAPKNGFFYVLDAATGELLSADKFAPADWAERIDLATGRPVERPGVRYGTTPVRVSPGPIGAHNWQPMAFNPGERLVYIPAMRNASNFTGPADVSAFRFQPGIWNQGLAPRSAGVAAAPVTPAAATATPTGFLTAWDPVTRAEKWRVDLPGNWNGGVLAAADLVFQGAGRELRAYRASDGRQVWSHALGAAAIAAPMTYQLGGVQHLAVMVGHGGATPAGDLRRPGRLMVFKLDGAATAPPFAEPVVPPFISVARAQPPAASADAEAGGVRFRVYCAACHGNGDFYRNLRRSPAVLSGAAFKAIVHDGAMRARGMAPFSRFMTEPQVEEIRAYLLREYAAAG